MAQPDEDWYTPVHTIEPIVRSKRAAATECICHDVSFRKQQILAIIRMMEENFDAFDAAIHADIGQGDFFTEVCEVRAVTDNAKILLKNLDEWVKPRKVPTNFPVNLSIPVQSYIEPNPRGLVLVISPWNFPFECSVRPVIEAIAAGNVCILKPSELSVHSSKLLADLVPKYVDPRVFSVVPGAIPQSTELLKHRFDAICYTGSTNIGKIVAAAAAKHLTPTLLELGGKNPAIVCDDADIESAALRLAWAKFTGNTGQFCATTDYIIVVESVKEKLANAIISNVRKFYGKDPKQSKDIGRIITPRHTERLVELLDDPTITVLHGGKYDIAERFIEPTVVDATIHSKCMQDEIFGPILPILVVPNVEAAVKYVRDNFTSKGAHPLALYVFSKSKASWQYVVNSIPSGGVTVNDTVKHPGNYNLPFGGVGTSGHGQYHGIHGFEFFSHMRSHLVTSNYASNPNDPAVWVTFPPYTKPKLAMLRAVGKLPDIWEKTLKFFMYMVLPVVTLNLAYTNPGLVDAVREFNINTIIRNVGLLIDWVGGYLS